MPCLFASHSVFKVALMAAMSSEATGAAHRRSAAKRKVMSVREFMPDEAG